MPNGVSCLYFAGKNFIYGKKEGNVFKDGIGVIQSVRGADFIASDNVIKNVAQTAAKTTKNPLLGTLNHAAKALKKILYPLIIVSGIYNTAKSKDKVKTGASQATGIGMMFGLEQVAEKALVTIEKKIFSNEALKNNKKAKLAWYVARGIAYATASLTGYKTGNKLAGKLVDNIREKKAVKKAQKEIKKQMKPQAAEDSKQAKAVENLEKAEKFEEASVFEDIESMF